MTPAGTREKEFTLQVQDRSVPGVMWLPLTVGGPSDGGKRREAGASGDSGGGGDGGDGGETGNVQWPRPLVLVGHGGTGDKRCGFVLDAVRCLVQGHGFVVAAIDGPIHGERRSSPASSDELREEFRAAWDRADTITPMVADWQGALDFLCGLPEVDVGAIAYYGLSMGTGYGLPLVAAEPRIKAAVLGMWGLSRGYTQRLLADAARIRCPVLFVQQWHDDRFGREEQARLFDAFAVDNRRMYVYPGGHVDPDATRLDDIVHFLTANLT